MMTGARRNVTKPFEYTAESVKVPGYYNRAAPGNYENDLSQTGQKTSLSNFKNVPSYSMSKENMQKSGSRNRTIQFQDFLKQDISNTRFS